MPRSSFLAVFNSEAGVQAAPLGPQVSGGSRSPTQQHRDLAGQVHCVEWLPDQAHHPRFIEVSPHPGCESFQEQDHGAIPRCFLSQKISKNFGAVVVAHLQLNEDSVRLTGSGG